jgi:hypothetical protein
MPSKQVTDREKSARAVAAAAETHANESATAVAQVLRPHLRSGETLPDLALLVRLAGRYIQAANADLVAADRAHDGELADDSAPRARRDEKAAVLREVIHHARATLESQYGAAGLRVLAMQHAPPADPSALATYTQSAIAALENDRIALPTPLRRSVSIDRRLLAEDLREHLPALSEALADVARESREAEATLVAKHEAMSRNDAAFSRAAAWITESFRLGGLDDLAARVRPSGRRPGVLAAEEEAPVAAPAPAPKA